MKKSILLLLFISFAFKSFGKEEGLGRVEILSKEILQVNGVFECTFRIYPNEDIKLSGLPTLKLPAGWKGALITFPQNYHCKKKMYFSFKITIKYPTGNLPF